MTKREYNALQAVTARAFGEYTRTQSATALLIYETLEEVQEMILTLGRGCKGEG